MEIINHKNSFRGCNSCLQPPSKLNDGALLFLHQPTRIVSHETVSLTHLGVFLERLAWVFLTE